MELAESYIVNDSIKKDNKADLYTKIWYIRRKVNEMSRTQPTKKKFKTVEWPFKKSR
jgi:hypothetical protein